MIDDPDFRAEAEACARDIEIERDERIAMAGADALVEENAKLRFQVAFLERRANALAAENATLQRRIGGLLRERAKA